MASGCLFVRSIVPALFLVLVCVEQVIFEICFISVWATSSTLREGSLDTLLCSSIGAWVCDCRNDRRMSGG